MFSSPEEETERGTPESWSIWSDSESLRRGMRLLLPSAQRGDGDDSPRLFVPSAATPEIAADLCAALSDLQPAAAVLLSSTEIYSPSFRSAGMVCELPPRRVRTEHGVAAGWRSLEEQFVAQCREQRIAATILRCAPFALRPGVLARLLSGGWALRPLGHDPLLQVLHPGDLVRAMGAMRRGAAKAQREAAGGVEVFHVVPRAPARLSKLAAASDTRMVPVPSPLLGKRARYWEHSWTASGERLRQRLGFAARHASLGPGSGDDALDPYGLDEVTVERLSRWVLRFLERYWRVQLHGAHHLPSHGPAVLAGMHRGLMPLDAMLLLHILRRERGRTPRFLIHPALQRFPFLSHFFGRLGGLVANRQTADWVLRQGSVLGLFPEGVQGAFCRYRDAYRIHRFQRHEFVRLAVLHGAPIVPVVHVGPAEVFPVLAQLHWRWWKELTGWPCLPITTSFPFLPPIPLPSKWCIELQPPIRPPRHGERAARDRQLVDELAQQVREVLEGALADLLARRRGRFFGKVEEPVEGNPAEPAA